MMQSHRDNKCLHVNEERTRVINKWIGSEQGMTKSVLHIGPNIRLFSRHYQDETSSEGMKLDNMEQSSPLNKQMERNCESEDSAFLSFCCCCCVTKTTQKPQDLSKPQLLANGS